MNSNSSDEKMMRMEAIANSILHSVVELKADEKGLLIYDESTERIAKAFEAAAKALHLTLESRKIAFTGHHGADPDPETVAMIPTAQVLICPTFYSLTHCAALTDARARGIRGATLPGITEELFLASRVDPDLLNRSGKRMGDRLNGTHEIEISSDAGTSLRFRIGRTPVCFETGYLNLRGLIGNVPCGEAYTAPDLGTMNGTLVVDGSIGSFEDWTPDSLPAVLTIQDGKAVHFAAPRGKALEAVLQQEGPSAFYAAEFGIGTNPEMKLTGNLLGDEKVKGTIHIAFGNNKSFGGENESTVHIDTMVLNPTLKMDGELIIYKGFWRI